MTQHSDIQGPTVLPFAAALASDPAVLVRAREMLAERFGEPVLELAPYPFTHTTYYASQTGSSAVKGMMVFRQRGEEPLLAEWKRWALVAEREIAGSVAGGLERPANLDPGYVSLGGVVLASTKEGPHRIWLGGGLFAELTLFWRGGGYEPMPWTYPDFREEGVRAFFKEARGVLLKERRRAKGRT